MKNAYSKSLDAKSIYEKYNPGQKYPCIKNLWATKTTAEKFLKKPPKRLQKKGKMQDLKNRRVYKKGKMAVVKNLDAAKNGLANEKFLQQKDLIKNLYRKMGCTKTPQ